MDLLVNPVAVGVVALGQFLLGGLWFSPLMFGNIWLAHAGVSETEARTRRMRSTLVTLAAMVVLTSVLESLIHATGSASFGAGARVGFFIWLGFVATAKAIAVSLAATPLKRWAVDAAFYGVTLTLAGGALAAWR